MANAVERIVRLSQRAAIAAFEVHFQKALQRSSDRPNPSPNPPSERKAKKPPTARRSHAEIIALSDRLLEVVRSDPGQPMAVLAPRIGVTASELQVPVARLKAAKKIKTVGQRHLTRYFPVAQEVAA